MPTHKDKHADKKKRRRPYDMNTEESNEINIEESQEAESVQSQNVKSKNSSKEESNFAAHTEYSETEDHNEETQRKIAISFPGSEFIRAKMPKPFAVAERVATDWVNHGDFSQLDLGNPFAEALAMTGLQRAKKIEQKILNSPQFEKLATQALTWGMKAQSEVQTLREQVKSKFQRPR